MFSSYLYIQKKREERSELLEAMVRIMALFIMIVSQVHTYFEHMNTLINMLYL